MTKLQVILGLHPLPCHVYILINNVSRLLSKSVARKMRSFSVLGHVAFVRALLYFIGKFANERDLSIYSETDIACSKIVLLCVLSDDWALLYLRAFDVSNSFN